VLRFLRAFGSVRTGGETRPVIVDVFLEIWALFVVTAIAGSFAAFFGSGDL
jgi:hypothetical protein